MGKTPGKTGEAITENMEEEIHVEVKNMLRADLKSADPSAEERALSEDEAQLLSDAYLKTAEELMIEAVEEERLLLSRQKAWPEVGEKTQKKQIVKKKKSASAKTDSHRKKNKKKKHGGKRGKKR